MSSARKKKQLEEEVQKLKKKSYNKKCFGCVGGVSTYVVPNLWIFVCDKVAGLMREVGFKANGIAMTSWTKEDVENIKAGGNKNGRKQWLKGFDLENLPNEDNTEGIRSFIKEVFVDKKYAYMLISAAVNDWIQVTNMKERANHLVGVEQDQIREEIKKPALVAPEPIEMTDVNVEALATISQY
eukprot:jgi/Bigna1/142363/aug1.69_g17071